MTDHNPSPDESADAFRGFEKAFHDAQEQRKQDLKDATAKTHPLSLIIKQGSRYRNITLDYSGGIRYPRLEKTGEGESSLDRLLARKTGGAPAG